MIKFIGTEAEEGHVYDKTKQGTQQKTGYDGDQDILKNIYDLKGNNLEWTAQACGTDNRVYRGGDFCGVSVYSWFLPASDCGYDNPSLTYINGTSRAGLFVNL